MLKHGLIANSRDQSDPSTGQMLADLYVRSLIIAILQKEISQSRETVLLDRIAGLTLQVSELMQQIKDLTAKITNTEVFNAFIKTSGVLNAKCGFSTNSLPSETKAQEEPFQVV